MLTIVLTLIIALVFSFLLTDGAPATTINLGASTLYNIPLFWVVFAAIVIGILLASVTTLKNIVLSKLVLFGQRIDLKKSNKTVEELEAKVNKLEEEKLKLKEELKEQGSSRKDS